METQSSRRYFLLRKSQGPDVYLCRTQPSAGTYLMTSEEVLQRMGYAPTSNFIILDIYDQKTVVVKKEIK